MPAISTSRVNVESLKIENRQRILRLLNTTGPISRKDIAEKLNLTQAAITKLTAEMIDQGLIAETGVLEESVFGRKKVLIDIVYSYKSIVGVNIGFDYTVIGISDLNGNALASTVVETPKEREPEAFLKDIAGTIKMLLWDNNIVRKNVLGIGVLIVGTVDNINGISKNTFGLWDKNVNIKSILERELDFQVTVENNVRGSALAEMEYSESNYSKNIFFVRLGYGIGSAVINNGEMLYGYNNMAGEFGHFVVDSNGHKCRCGQTGCLETIASERAILQDMGRIFSKESTPVLYNICNSDIKNIAIKNIIQASEQGDKVVVELLRKAAGVLGQHIAMCAQLINPEVIVLYGNLFRSGVFYSEIAGAVERGASNFNLKNLKLSFLNNKNSYFGGFATAAINMFYKKGGLD